MTNPFTGVRLFEEPKPSPLRAISGNPFSGISLFEAETPEQKKRREEEEKRKRMEAWRAARMPATAIPTEAIPDVKPADTSLLAILKGTLGVAGTTAAEANLQAANLPRLPLQLAEQAALKVNGEDKRRQGEALGVLLAANKQRQVPTAARGPFDPGIEAAFQSWYADVAARQGLDPDPDAPEHQYDYRAAFMANAKPGEDGHWPSRFKLAGHQNRFVGGEDTATGSRDVRLLQRLGGGGPIPSAVPDPLAGPLQMAAGWREGQTQELAEATQDLPTPLAAAIFTGATMTGLAADASQYVGARVPGVGREAAEAAAKAVDPDLLKLAYLSDNLPVAPARSFDDLADEALAGLGIEKKAPGVAVEAPEAPKLGITALGENERLFVVRNEGGEEIASLVARQDEDGFRVKHVFVDESRRGEALPEQLYRKAHEEMGAYRGSTDYQGRRTPAGERMTARLQQTAPEIFEETPQPGLIPEGAALPPKPLPGAGPGTLPDPLAPLRGGEGAKTLPLPTLKMSTKATENVAGMKDEFHQLVREHLPELEAARGPVRPASVWHDAQKLADMTGMTMEDFLASPAGRHLDDAEVSLAKHYMAGAQHRFADLDKRLAGGLIPEAEREVARTELAKLAVDKVRMMSIVQKGYSEFGRGLRSGQEALAAFTGTPKERLQYSLLQRYGAQNAEEAAQIEAKAISRLKRQAAAEARKAKRAATAEELATELDGLRSEFRSAMSRPRAGLDPELVGIVGKMAKNRVAAGIVEVEKIADDIYMFARDYLEGVTREDIKAAIVQATEPPGKAPKVAKPKLTPEQAKLARMEGAVQRQIDQMEKRIAKGPKLPGQAVGPVDSSKLQELRQRAADLRSQIEVDPREGLAKRYRELLDDQTVEMIAKLPDPEKDPAALIAFLGKMERPRFKDFRTAYWINSILSGTKTLTRNLAGNAVRLAEQTAMRPAGAAVEQFILAPLQGRSAERLLRESVPATVGVFRGLPEGIKRFAFVMKEGYDPARLIGELTGETVEKFDAGARLPISPFLLSQKPAVRKLGTVVTMPSRILEATDAMFKVMAHTSEQYAWATRKAVQEKAPDIGKRVSELIAEQPDEMLEAARAFAKKATYQDPMSWVGRTASAARRGVPGADKLARDLRAQGGVGNKALAGLVEAPATIGQHLMPFIHISDRVAAGVTDFIPFSKPFKTARLLAEKSPEAADLIARQVVGGALGMLGVSWAASGKLVGEAPRDEKLRNDFYADGKQPYSLLIGGHWVPMRDALGPLAGPFVAAAMYHDHIKVGEDPSEAVAGMALGSARYMLDASYMQTLQDVIQAVDQEATGQAGRGLTQAGARVASGYVPFSGLQRNIATATDPRVVDKEGFLDELKSGIPGLRGQIPSRVDSLGNPIVSNTGFWGGFSPMVPTESKVADPQLAEDVGRLRYTLQAKRREAGQIEAKVKDAMKAGNDAAIQELMEGLPPVRTEGSPWATAWFDARLDQVRQLEDAIRQVRAGEQDREEKMAIERDLMSQIKALLEDALGAVKPAEANPFEGVSLFEGE